MFCRYYDLPSLTALAVFEASARHLSFKLAASELNVTPGTVSRQIKAIEDELGIPLFVRLGTGVMLTSAGEDLYDVLASSFSRGVRCCQDHQARRSLQERHHCLHRCFRMDVADTAHATLLDPVW
jgi:DNA-binding transcriptional LysR family regulator